MLTYLLIAINVIVSLIAFKAGGHDGPSNRFVFSPYEVSKGRNYAGMILSHFSHGDAMHLLFNMMTLYYFCDKPEFFLGIPITVLIYIVGGIVSTMVVYYRHRA